jgi:hypothetical protein
VGFPGRRDADLSRRKRPALQPVSCRWPTSQ